MRTLILATTAAFGISIAAPAVAQQSTAPGQQQIHSGNSSPQEWAQRVERRRRAWPTAILAVVSAPRSSPTVH